jgi:hypothetical protein
MAVRADACCQMHVAAGDVLHGYSVPANRVLKTTNAQAGRSSPIGEGWNAPNFTPTSTWCAIGVFLISVFRWNQHLAGRRYDVGTA